MGAQQQPEWVEVGRILKAHGVRGELSVLPETDLPKRFSPGSRLRVVFPPPLKERNLEVISYRSHGNALLIRFEGITDRDMAGQLRGGVLKAPRLDRPREEGAWFHYELVGCSCRDIASEQDLGRVTDVIDDGGGALLVVEREDKRCLVPFVQVFLETVDPDAGIIEVRLPEGLIELCGSAL